MPSILIAYPIDHTSLILADKLRSENDIDLTFFVDPSITNVFMTTAVNDLKSVSTTMIKATDSQVNLNFHTLDNNSYFELVQDWREFDFVVFCNLNVYPYQSDKEYADTINNLFK